MLAFTLREMGIRGAGFALALTTDPKLGAKLGGYGFDSHGTPWIGRWLKKLSITFIYWVDKEIFSDVPWCLTIADSDQDFARL